LAKMGYECSGKAATDVIAAQVAAWF